MNRSVRILPQADRDIDEHFLYISRDDSNAAFRFLDATRDTMGLLIEIPDIGTLWGFE